ncbi:hypothetical protein AB0B81_30630, partial [Streptomyces sp. NPDC039028]
MTAPPHRRSSRLTRRQRRLFRLARTVTAAGVLVAGGFWWAGDEEPVDPVLAAAPAVAGRAGDRLGHTVTGVELDVQVADFEQRTVV